jgi:hypothetical protein
MPLVEIKVLIADGYERTAQVIVAGSSETVWCHFIQHDEYLEAGEKSAKLKAGDRIEGRFSIQLVTEYSLSVDTDVPGFSQPINESSHIIAVGKVIEKIDDFSFLCDFGSLGDAVPVEFEDAADIEPGASVKVRGSLELESD